MRRLCVLAAAAVMMVACSSQVQPAEPAPVAQTPVPHSNLAQVMRGIPFTFANIVFDTQTIDPSAPREPADVSGGATATFRNVYGGWQEVENSALALAEAANLLMIPGRFCENGRPAPVNDERYRTAAEGLAAAGLAAYKAAQTKSRDEMIAVSEIVSEACAACHEPYRDFDDPKDRCMPIE